MKRLRQPRFVPVPTLLLLFLIATLTVSESTPKNSAGGFSQNQNEPASTVLEQFLDEYYRKRVGNLTAFLDKYTDWPDFGPGDSVKVASGYSIRKLQQTEGTARFEVTFKAICEESLGKIVVTDGQDTQIYNVERRQNGWRIVEPINMRATESASSHRRIALSHLDVTLSRLDIKMTVDNYL